MNEQETLNMQRIFKANISCKHMFDGGSYQTGSCALGFIVDDVETIISRPKYKDYECEEDKLHDELWHAMKDYENTISYDLRNSDGFEFYYEVLEKFPDVNKFEDFVLVKDGKAKVVSNEEFLISWGQLNDRS